MANEIGLIGLGRMGRNLAANMSERGIAVWVWDESAEAVARACAKVPALSACAGIKELVAALAPQRCVMVMVPDGDAVDNCLHALSNTLDKGDVIIDAGNSFYRDTEHRQDDLLKNGFHLLGLGVSGGIKGARNGPSLMAGGPVTAWQRAAPVLETIAARVGHIPCAGHFGEGGAGHFVKMVHNGIEYAILQILADVFDLLSLGCGMHADEVAEAFGMLNSGPTASFLVKVSERIVASRDEAGTGFLIDSIDDRAEQKGTGRWAVDAAADFGVAVPTIAAAVDFRTLSSSRAYGRGSGDDTAVRLSSRPISREKVVPFLGPGVGCAMASAFQQGFQLIDAAGQRFGAQLDKSHIAQVWRSGCILKGEMVNRIADNLSAEPSISDVLGSSAIGPLLKDGVEALHELSMAALSVGRPAPGLSSAAGYIDALRGAPLSTRFIQMQRDYFGAHGYRRVGQDALRHGPWGEDDGS